VFPPFFYIDRTPITAGTSWCETDKIAFLVNRFSYAPDPPKTKGMANRLVPVHTFFAAFDFVKTNKQFGCLFMVRYKPCLKACGVSKILVEWSSFMSFFFCHN
jgi:hypothetical protein